MTGVGTVLELTTCAARHLRHYVDPNGPRAFRVYDRQGDPHTFEPLDALAPGLLDAAVNGSIVIELFADTDTPYRDLRLAIQSLLDETADHEPDFGELDLDDHDGAWQLVREVLRRSDLTRGLAAAMVTKMLHRKRPRFVPIFDSKVAKFYDTTARTPWELWPLLQADLNNARGVLDRLVDGCVTVDGRPLSPLRALDIIVWEHEITGCADGRAST